MQPSTTTAGSVASGALVATARSGVGGRGGVEPALGRRGARGRRTGLVARGLFGAMPERAGGRLLLRASSTGDGGT